MGLPTGGDHTHELAITETVVQSCYQGIAKKLVVPSGEIVLRWDVNAEGKAKTAEVVKDGIGNPIVLQCALNASSHLSLPGSEGFPCQATHTYKLVGE